MNLALLFDDDFIGNNKVRLSGRRHQQIFSIHKSTLGDTVKVGKLNANMGTGVITVLNEDFVELTVELNQAPPTPLPMRLITALARPLMMRRIFSGAAEFGIKDIIVINTSRVEKSFWQSPSLAEEKISELLYLGLEQAKDTIMPKVTFHKRFRPFVEDDLPALLTNTRALIAHPESTTNCPHALTEHVTLAVGPEGGFIPFEVDQFLAAGFEAINMGPRIYKVENAISFLTAKLFP
ncbi:MAG: 16S rRNA (uracil1498-N3)-methyltransferase [Pseudomonadales bacterium]|jgi:16S rRNA (uracil1498-N3)-methyltransferase